MPFGQSIPVSAPVAVITGFVSGELCGAIASALGVSELWQRLATVVGHTIASAATGYTVNLMLGGDITGAAVTTVQSIGTAVIHDSLRHKDTLLHSALSRTVELRIVPGEIP